MFRQDITVTMEKSVLLKELTANRDKHKDDHETAVAGYRLLLQQELEQKLADLKAGKHVNKNSNLQEPESYYPTYMQIIRMLEFAKETEIPVTHENFLQWVEDQWDWQQHWVASNSVYIEAAGAR